MTSGGQGLSRRQILSSTAIALLFGFTGKAGAATYGGSLPWEPFSALPPRGLAGGKWYFFTADEARTIEAIVDRLIPADDLSVGGKDAGCAEFIDRQLAGSFGSSSRLYTKGPFLPGLPTQGYQGEAAPATIYRTALAAINDITRKTFDNKAFADLTPADQDKFLTDLEAGKIKIDKAPTFFAVVLQNTMEGFFADPIYGGNRDMAGWKMIGFPGARYDYRDYVAAHNQPFPLGPVSIAGRAEWSTR